MSLGPVALIQSGPRFLTRASVVLFDEMLRSSASTLQIER
jgi:hypothetical protein